MVHTLDPEEVRSLWEAALREDGADRDVTSIVAVAGEAKATARLIAGQPGVFAGRVVVDLAAEDGLAVKQSVEDGDAVQPGDPIGTLTGPVRRLLGIERTLLNFLQRLSGVATLTRLYVEAVKGTATKIYDTRKTIPGWRHLDKYAVRCGGGCNHRMGLHDAILIKDNHLAGKTSAQLAADVAAMVKRAAGLDPRPTFFECEVDTLGQFDALLPIGGIDVILLDNFTLEQLCKAVERRDAAGLKGKVELEASGGVDLDSARSIAQTGVDRIAVGALTHSAAALDINMEM